MQLKLTVTRCLAQASCLSPVLSQSNGYCYDAEQHPAQFSDLGSRLDIARALTETCETPIGDQMYACNAAKALNVPMPNNASGSFVFHFASLQYVNQSIPETGPCGDVYLSHASCVDLGMAAIDMCEHGGEVAINETVAAGGRGEKPVTAWLQVIPFI